MAASVKPIPDECRGATPYLTCKGAAAALAFYEKAFGAKTLERIDMPGGLLGHAEVKIGDAMFMMADECEHSPMKSPQSLGGTSVSVYIYVQDVDALVAQAAAAGAQVIQAPEDKFYGDRSAMLRDPYGHLWGFASRKENLTFDEVRARAAKMFGGG